MTNRDLLAWLLPGVVDCLVPGLLAWLNPTGAPGPLLVFEHWCDGSGMP
jgi:hypothetical protein